MGGSSSRTALISAAFAAASLLAQDHDAAPGKPPKSKDRAAVKAASISGVVLNSTGQTMRRAFVTLTAHSAGVAGQNIETDDLGRFRFDFVESGVYSIGATRDGYLPGEYAFRGTLRMPRQFGVYPEDRWSDVTFRLDPWGVIAGRVKFGDDAEAAMRVPVHAYRKRHWHGRVEYQLAGSARSDDRGDYRISGLRPGSYVLAAIYDKPRKPADGEEQLAAEELAKQIVDSPPNEPSYASTFFTSATRVADAVPLDLAVAREMTGVDLYLHSARSTRVRGRVTDGCTGSVTLAAMDVFRAGEEEIAAIPANTQMFVNPGGFVIRGLSPGTYVLFAKKDADAKCPPRSYRRTFYVNETPFDDVEVLLAPFEKATFALAVDGAQSRRESASNYRVRLLPKYRQQGAITLNFDDRRGAVALLDPNERYSVVLEKAPAGHYLRGPLEIQGGPGGIAIQIGARGATVAAMVRDDQKKPVPGASVTMIPEMQSRLAQPFTEGFAELDGGAVLRGIAPGTYLAVPWLDGPPCDFHAPDAFRTCAGVGAKVTVKDGEEKWVDLELKAK